MWRLVTICPANDFDFYRVIHVRARKTPWWPSGFQIALDLLALCTSIIFYSRGHLRRWDRAIPYLQSGYGIIVFAVNWLILYKTVLAE